MEIRPLAAADATAYQRVRLTALQEFPAAFASSYEEEAEFALDFIATRLTDLTDSGGALFGAFDDVSELVGMVGVRQDEHHKLRHKAHIFAMYVAPQKQGLGVGKQLMQAAIARARGMEGVELLYLEVEENNTAARRLYESLGFQPFGVEPRDIKIGETYYACVHMWMVL